jgi:hypothetical protein
MRVQKGLRGVRWAKRAGAIVESPRDVPYGDISLQECMYSLPTILPCSRRNSGQRVHTHNTKVDNFWVWASKLFAKLFSCFCFQRMFFL